MAERPKSCLVEQLHRLDVSYDWPDAEEVRPSRRCLNYDVLDEKASDPLVPERRANNDGLDFALFAIQQEASEADDRAIAFRDPHCREVRSFQISRVEIQTGVTSTNRLVFVDVAMSLSQVPPQPTAGLQIGSGVWTNRDICPHD
jgi:hypothetical protein